MIQSTSIKSIFDKTHIDSFYFGNMIKTYIVPAKYNQNDPYVSQTGEYFLIFTSPPVAWFDKYTVDHPNDNVAFTNFIRNFHPDYTYYGCKNPDGTLNEVSTDKWITQYFVFKINIIGDLTYVGAYKLVRVSTTALKDGMPLSLFTDKQLILDEYSNVKGLKLPLDHGQNGSYLYEPRWHLPIKFGDENDPTFTLEFVARSTDTKSEYMTDIYRISTYYSFGDGYLVSTPNKPYYLFANSADEKPTSPPTFGTITDTSTKQSVPLYYSENGITWTLKHSWQDSTFVTILPNIKNQKQLAVFHNKPIGMMLDFIDSGNVETIKLSNVLRVEYIKDDIFNVVFADSQTKLCKCTFSFLTKKFTILSSISLASTFNNSARGSSFEYLNNTFHETFGSGSGTTYNNIQTLNYSAVSSLANQFSTFYVNNSSKSTRLVRETQSGMHYILPSVQFFYAEYIYGNVCRLPIKNIGPLYYEFGNWTIFQNYSLIIPNTTDILKNKRIVDGISSDTNFIYSADGNVNVVKIKGLDNSIKSVTGNIVKVNTINNNTALYSFSNLLEIDLNVDSTDSDYSVINYGAVNNFISYDKIMNNTDIEKYFIVRIDNGLLTTDVNNFYVDIYLKYNEMVKFSKDGNFLKFNDASLYFSGKEITNINDIQDLYSLTKETFKNNIVDISALDNNVNTYIPNITVLQNSIDDVLTAFAVIDGEDIGFFDIESKGNIKYYNYIKPAIHNTTCSFIIDHFKDSAGTIYLPNEIEFVCLSINENITDFNIKVHINGVPTTKNISNSYYSEIYTIEPIADLEDNYNTSGNNINISDTTVVESINITRIDVDSTTIELSATDMNAPYRFEVDLMGLEISHNDQIDIVISCDATNIDNDMGYSNIFDNVLYSDAIGVTAKTDNSLYGNQIILNTIASAVEFQRVDKPVLAGFPDIYSYGIFSEKCPYYILLDSSTVPLLNLSLNTTLFENGGGTYSYTYYNQSLNFYDINENVQYNAGTPIQTYDVAKKWKMEFSTGIGSYRGLSQLDYKGLHQFYDIENANNLNNQKCDAVTFKTVGNLKSLYTRHYTRLNVPSVSIEIAATPIVAPFNTFMFGIFKGTTLPYNYIGCGNPCQVQVFDNGFYGFNVALLEQFDKVAPISVYVDRCFENTPRSIDLVIDGTSTMDMMERVDYVPTGITIPPITSSRKWFAVGEYFTFEKYFMYFNCGLNAAELATLDTDMYTIGETSYNNAKQSIGVAERSIPLIGISKNNINLSIKHVGTKIRYYVNGFLFREVESAAYGTVPYELNTLKLFGNKQIGNKTLTIKKYTNSVSELVSKYY